MTMSNLYFKQLPAGPMQNFVYLIGDTRTREAVAVDPAWDIDGLLRILEADGMALTHALITHFHPDHLGGDLMGHHIDGAAELLQRNQKIKIVLHKAESGYAHRIAGLSASDLTPVESGDAITVGDLTVTCIHTPGHTPGSQCFLVGNRLVSGDTLFIGSCGRVDLPGSDPAQLWDSLINKLKRLHDDTVLYPGHDYADRPTSTLGEEKRRNPYMRFERLEDFLSVMGY
jgi:glyoxylase-like metal-dependent hydrolase (beta-lactamase superfamily II)